MGAWGSGIFENDDAADWVYAFNDEGASAVDAALTEALEGASQGYLEAPAGSVGLAASEVVAASFGQPMAGLSEELSAAVNQYGASVKALDDVMMRSRRAVVAVLGQTADGKGTESELLELWSEGDVAESDFESFKAAVTDLALRLKAASA